MHASRTPRGQAPILLTFLITSPHREISDRITAPKFLRRTSDHLKIGFYHDGRFGTLKDVLEHYNGHFKLGLTDAQKNDLAEYLKSI